MIKLISSCTAQEFSLFFFCLKSRRKQEKVKVINEVLQVLTVEQTRIF